MKKQFFWMLPVTMLFSLLLMARPALAEDSSGSLAPEVSSGSSAATAEAEAPPASASSTAGLLSTALTDAADKMAHPSPSAAKLPAAPVSTFSGVIPLAPDDASLPAFTNSTAADVLVSGSMGGVNSGASLELVCETIPDSASLDVVAAAPAYDPTCRFTPLSLVLNANQNPVRYPVLQRVVTVRLQVDASRLPGQTIPVNQIRVLREHAGVVEELECRASYDDAGTLSIGFQTDRFSVFQPVVLAASSNSVQPPAASGTANSGAAEATVSSSPEAAASDAPPLANPSQSEPDAPAVSSGKNPDTGIDSLTALAGMLGLVSAAGIFAFRKKK